MARTIGILTAGGDSPGLNAAIRAVGKAAQRAHDMHVIGFRDGFQGLMQNRFERLDGDSLSGILTKGGTVLGTSRLKVHRVDMGDGDRIDMRPMIQRVVDQHDLAAIVCLGGGGTMKNALRLHTVGIPVVTLPKTIDNDVYGTDTTFGFDTALGIATEAIDRLHSTAHSHHRIMVVETMGHNTGWLTLGAGLAGGADAILVPEIPYSVDSIAESILQRKAAGSSFSIVAVAEGAMSGDVRTEHDRLKDIIDGDDDDAAEEAEAEIERLHQSQSRSTEHVADALADLTGLEARVTILGHVQRGGTPSAVDRVLATQLGTAAADSIAQDQVGVMIAMRDGAATPVPLEEVAGRRKSVPLDHPWIESARRLGVCLGD
ncbi:MAG: ATP-dependent 6-phosphofructokinase [Acidimicrobiia bacterium]|nr:ATP-dependent 6-phosphofructokinase [Acidimicrobiia bacterium]MDH4307322.1 ATP-dependent 6-phosphofructokinase [Acidimicrobiia bacterium]MDH5292104.1 ATP-dependent 6-phosphofructokinase [Acidimicrobiia bacterium]MDH5519770.1 ATP-dependent 6-phosphofructokinase [Acidimicrobiia bacterium]